MARQGLALPCLAASPDEVQTEVSHYEISFILTFIMKCINSYLLVIRTRTRSAEVNSEEKRTRANEKSETDQRNITVLFALCCSVHFIQDLPVCV
jgi:hypothetical protein